MAPILIIKPCEDTELEVGIWITLRPVFSSSANRDRTYCLRTSKVAEVEE